MKHVYNGAAGFAAVAALALLLTGPLVVHAADEEAEASADNRAKAASANINTSRSNPKGRSNPGETAPAATGDCDDANDCPVPGIDPAAVSGAPPGTAAAAPAQDHNASRSNKTSAIRDDVGDEPCTECDEACKDCAPAQPQAVSPRR